ncbi:MAG TPA: hypothetical protein VFK05_19155 [Polyangiaceae bacterium]|nr:hypothetical protein [Polyangiaceae bacterium]
MPPGLQEPTPRSEAVARLKGFAREARRAQGDEALGGAGVARVEQLEKPSRIRLLLAELVEYEQSGLARGAPLGTFSTAKWMTATNTDEFGRGGPADA